MAAPARRGMRERGEQCQAPVAAATARRRAVKSGLRPPPGGRKLRKPKFQFWRRVTLTDGCAAPLSARQDPPANPPHRGWHTSGQTHVAALQKTGPWRGGGGRLNCSNKPKHRGREKTGRFCGGRQPALAPQALQMVLLHSICPCPVSLPLRQEGAWAGGLPARRARACARALARPARRGGDAPPPPAQAPRVRKWPVLGWSDVRLVCARVAAAGVAVAAASALESKMRRRFGFRLSKCGRR